MLDRSRPRKAPKSSRSLWQILDAVDFDSAASGPNASANKASMSRSDKPRTHTEITNASSGTERTTPLPNSVEANRSLGIAQLRAFQLDRPRSGADRQIAMTVGLTDTFGFAAAVPTTAEPRRDLIPEDLLAHEMHRMTDQVLHTLLDRPPRTEHLNDVGTNGLDRRYSLRHGVGLLR